MSEKTVKVDLKEKSYNIFIKENILSTSGSYINQLKVGKKILLVTQSKIPSMWLQKVKESLIKKGFKVFVLMLPSGEENKDLISLLKIVNFAVKKRFERNDSFCAVGGGVVSDLTGFAASIYCRGINFICIPTTLLGMVDAAIGGKTGVNIKEGKNLLGTFYQPKIVIIDPRTLETLPKREFLVGMGEVIKYALLEQAAKTRFSKISFFSFLKNKRKKILKLQTKELLQIIYYSAFVKAQVVSKDEKESNLRAILNLGHTFAHGIEQAFNYKKYTHGEAVSIGMCLAGRLAVKQNLISKQILDSVISLVSDYGLPVKLEAPFNLNKIIKSMLLDKKNKDGKFRFVLPVDKIGKVEIISGILVKDIKPLFQ